MAGRLTKNDWSRVSELLEADPAAFGMPEGGRERSLVLGSFNIRKLGAVDRRERELEFLARFCARCDSVAVQEVQDDLAGLRHLRARADAHVAGQGEFSLAVSDITGQVPGDPGMAERLGFLYRNRRIRRLDMASDLTFDRTAVLERLFAHEDVWQQARQDHDEKLAAFAAGERKTKPTFVPPVFLTFVRTPYVVAFEAPAANDMPALTFTAVNAHLVYGSKKEREQEFAALLDWLIHRLKRASRLVAPNFVLLGDLNLDFDRPRKDRERIDALLRGLNAEAFGDPGIRRVYFPFLDRHPVLDKVFRTNARADQTFDQIAFFNGRRERRLPNDQWHALIAAGDADGFDYGVFDFADLFARALRGKSYGRLSKAEKKDLGKKFEHSVSDHLPIWVRIPRPGFAPPPAPA